jgi:hypothetical protein
MTCTAQAAAPSMLTLLDQDGLRSPLIALQLQRSLHASINHHLWALAALPHKEVAGQLHQQAAMPVHVWWTADCLGNEVVCSLSAMRRHFVRAHAAGPLLATLLQHHNRTTRPSTQTNSQKVGQFHQRASNGAQQCSQQSAAYSGHSRCQGGMPCVQLSSPQHGTEAYTLHVVRLSAECTGSLAVTSEQPAQEGSQQHKQCVPTIMVS